MIKFFKEVEIGIAHICYRMTITNEQLKLPKKGRGQPGLSIYLDEAIN